jgi:hypothetical protein
LTKKKKKLLPDFSAVIRSPKTRSADKALPVIFFENNHPPFNIKKNHRVWLADHASFGWANAQAKHAPSQFYFFF